MKTEIAAVLAAGLVLTPMTSIAQPTESTNAIPPPLYSRTASPADDDFVAAMLAEGQAQIALAQLAQGRATSVQTRDFARQSEAEWTAFTQRLSAIATEQGLATSNGLAAAGQAELDSLRATTDGFDAAYLAAAGRADERALSRMQAERRSGNPALVAAANDNLHWFATAVAMTSSASPTMPSESRPVSGPDE